MLKTAYLKLLYGLFALAALFIVASVPIIIANAMGRTTGAYGLLWGDATVAYILQFSTMFAAPWILHEHGHIFTTAVRSMLPPRYRRLHEDLVYILCAALCLGMAAFGAYGAWNAAATGATDIRSITIPGWILYASLIPGFGLMGVEFLVFLFSRQSMFSGDRVTA